MAKERAIPRHELPGHQLWWNEGQPIPVKATRAQRAAEAKRRRKKKAKAPTWTIVIMILSVIALVAGLTVVYLDIYRGRLLGTPTPRTSVAEERPSKQILRAPPSPDTIKRRIQKVGFKVDYLESVADRKNLAYDVAKTHIEGHPALILVFKDHATVLKWVERAVQPVVYKNAWAVSVPDQDLAGQIALKLEADLRG